MRTKNPGRNSLPLGLVAVMTIFIFSVSTLLVILETSHQYNRSLSSRQNTGWLFTDLERKLGALDSSLNAFNDLPDSKNQKQVAHALDEFDKQLSTALAIAQSSQILDDPAIRSFVDRTRGLLAGFRKSADTAQRHESLQEHLDFLKGTVEGLTAKILIQDLGRAGPDKTGLLSKKLVLGFAVMAASGIGLIIFLLRQATTSQKLARTAQEAEKLLSNRLAAIEASDDGIGLIDKEGRLLYMNAALAKLHAIEDLDAFIGKPVKNLYTPKGQSQLENKIFPLLRKNGSWRGESPVVQQTGIVIQTELSLTLLPDGGMIGTARDISERKKTEAEQKLLQEQLFQAQKMEAIGRLAGGIAHDFNNVLASIIGYAEFLTEDLQEGSAQNRFASQILKAGHKARDLVEQILTFSRKGKTAQEAIKATEAIDEIVGLLSSTVPRTITIQKTILFADARIQANSSQIHQVLMNLCVNAIDAMEDKTGRLEISLYTPDTQELEKISALNLTTQQTGLPIRIETIDEATNLLTAGKISGEKTYCCISVSDTGTGISRDLMEKIFEPFFTTKEAGKGTGLGLATALGIISSHEGCLTLQSTRGKGSCFRIYLPMLLQDRFAHTQKPAEKKLQGSETILIVDDEAGIGDMMTAALERLGYKALFCDSADSALKLLKTDPTPCQLVITDYSMPGMNGFELAKAIYEKNRGLPVIMITGFAGTDIENMSAHPALRGVFKKPVDMPEISRAIRKNLDGAA